ncbi:hypothetical protein FIBSPDRAFT_908140 [Athelia psychrophila]|uniref:Zn(2)-C6 fungal-type domain-containing protein n=1 Tax=Athelia psychrophila TaxID=1759441 RepID=A0A166T356_9AGAM|nr:hypothetical protein FIBSPDRAFT_908140 [Fibularhizoctonia sp. CBS 109695]
MSSSRRGKILSEEEIESKRARGEITCAECKRSKLKCDKQIPCGACVRRGCSSVCPSGIILTRLGHRTILPDMEQLHRKISEMSQRIRQLEDALAILQSSVSTEPHALLADELLLKKSDPDPPGVPKDVLTETTDAFGTLTIDDSGEAKYFGPSAGLETLLLASATVPMDIFDAEACAPALLNKLASTSSMGGGGAPDSDTFENAMDMLFAGLPSRNRAWSLCETYLEHSSFHFQLSTRQELIDDILTPIFNAKKELEDPACERCIQISPHKFAFLYLVFAQGVLVDLTLPAFHVEGEKFHHYSLAAMALRPCIDNPTVEAVQSILLMAHYRSTAGERYTRDSVWALVSLGCKLAQISLALGRPPSLELSYVDCDFPTGEDLEDSDAQYWKWKYQFIRDVFGSVLKLTLAATPPSYKAILELDRKVRDMVLPPALNVFLRAKDEEGHIDAGSYMKGCLLSQIRSFSMLFIHRSFFAQALLDHPENPLRSPYATSFLATYRAATVCITATIKHTKRYPDLFKRWWVVWTQLFSAAIVVGSVATKAPSSNMASSAFIELNLAVDLFERGAGTSERAKAALAVLKTLRGKAFFVLSQHRSSSDGNTPSPALTIFNSQEDGTDELALFGGQTRLVISKNLTANQEGAMNNPSASSDSAPPPSGPWPDQGILQDIHPSLVQYASLLSPTGFATEFTDQPVPEFESQLLGQAGVNGSPPAACNTQTPVHLQARLHSLAGSGSFAGNPNSLDLFQQLFPEGVSTDASILDTWGANDMTDLGQMMSIDSDMDEEWMAFMKESGIVNPAAHGA